MLTTVQTVYGTVKGIEQEDFTLFCGVPYAAPPIGERRWKEPQKPDAWEGVRSCTGWPAIPWQPHGWVGEKALRDNRQDEDCLYLNIWTPAKSADEKLPVLVWIHGGGFMGGCAHEELYSGETFAKKGVIVVSVSYRLGIFGFLAHPELSRESEHQASGNYGILDQIQALRWIQENIGAFGGNPEAVTVAGQSAGGMSVGILLSSPLTKGLFQGAIIQSGGPDRDRCPILSEEERRGLEAENLCRNAGLFWQNTEVSPGHDETLSCGCVEKLRAISPEKLISLEIGTTDGLFYRPCVDGYVLTETPYEAMLNGRMHPVPILMGSNTDEHLFGKEKSDHQNVCDLAEKLIDSHSSPVYVYLFGQKSRDTEDHLIPAGHSAELFYVFSTLDVLKGNITPDGKEQGIVITKEAENLSEMMNNYWKNFVKCGNPNEEGLPLWKNIEKQKEYLYLESGQVGVRGE